MDSLALGSFADLTSIGASVVGMVAGMVAAIFAQLAARRAHRALGESEQQFRATLEITRAAAESQPSPPALEDEIAEVSDTLSRAVSRLHQISEKAQDFEAEVRELVTRAEAARATAQLHEDDARKIALILDGQTEQRLNDAIEKLTAAHNEQIARLKRAGTKTAWLTFALGAVVGFIGNIITQLLLT